MKNFFTVAKAAMLCGTISVLAACGGTDEDEASSANISEVTGGASSCSHSYPDTIGYDSLLSRNKGEVQCTSLLQGAESYRQQAIALCKAGNASAAETSYSYYKKSLPSVEFMCL